MGQTAMGLTTCQDLTLGLQVKAKVALHANLVNLVGNYTPVVVVERLSLKVARTIQTYHPSMLEEQAEAAMARSLITLLGIEAHPTEEQIPEEAVVGRGAAIVIM